MYKVESELISKFGVPKPPPKFNAKLASGVQLSKFFTIPPECTYK